ncbi:lipopolysaccharide biosynthesis protein [Verrucomicrobiaceae bacterium R5-34]|nr:lipopolysaccharide biosynthesis protein [Verrucomicrobiaceae bacterium R5-34]
MSDEVEKIKRKSVRGGFIIFASQLINVFVQIASIIVLARLLTPEDYGLIGMVIAVTAFAQLFKDLGLSSAVIQTKSITEEQKNSLYWVNVSLGVLVTIIVFISAPLVAGFYGVNELKHITQILSLQFLLGGCGSQLIAHLTREMQYGRLAIIKVVSVVSGLIVAILVAYLGGGYWALVVNVMTIALVSLVLSYFLTPWRPSFPKIGGDLSALMSFGVDVALADTVNYFSRNLDNILIGKYVGSNALGIYSRAYQLLMFPVSQIRSPILSIAYPAMSKLGRDTVAYREYYKNTVEIIALLSMPLCVFLYLASYEIVVIALGHKWVDAVAIFKILALAAFIQPVTSLRGVLMLSSNQSRKNLYVNIVTTVVTSVSMLIGVRWGVEGVAWSYVLCVWLLPYPVYLIAIRSTSVNKYDIFHAVRLPCAIVVLMVVFGSLLLVVDVDNIYFSLIFKLLILMSALGVICFINERANAMMNSGIKYALSKLRKSQ